MVPDRGWIILFVVFATSLGLGAVTTYFLVKWAEKAALWAFALPFTLWWLVAGLSVAVHLCGVRISLPTQERPAAAPGAPLTPRGTIEADAL